MQKNSDTQAALLDEQVNSSKRTFQFVKESLQIRQGDGAKDEELYRKALDVF